MKDIIGYVMRLSRAMYEQAGKWEWQAKRNCYFPGTNSVNAFASDMELFVTLIIRVPNR